MLTGENTSVVKTIESDEIVGHVPGFLAQVLAPKMQSGEIALIDAAAKKYPRVYMGAWRRN